MPEGLILLEALVKLGRRPTISRAEIAAPAAKDEQRAAVRVELQHRLHPRGQTVEAFSHIGDAARQIDADIARNADHESADNTRRSAVSSTAPVIRSVTPEGSSTSIMPPVGRSASARVAAGSAGGEGAPSCPTGAASVTGANPVSSPVRNCRRHV